MYKLNEISTSTDVLACTTMKTGVKEAFILLVSNLTLSRAPRPAGNGFPMEQ